MIGFIGTVFSPWYHWSGRGRPDNHVCLNVVTRGGGVPRFTMTDRGAGALRQSADTLQIGPSRMHWTGGALVIDIDEAGAPPLFGRVKGRITLTPQAVTETEAVLDAAAHHIWRPFAPVSRITVELGGQSWQGHGYFDANFGARPLEADFRRWTWGRYAAKDRSVVFYDGLRRDGSTLALAVQTSDGVVTPIAAPPLTRLPRTGWLLPRETRADPGTKPRQKAMLLDAPFYSRAAVEVSLQGETMQGMHEALDLDRYAWPWLKPMIALRVPRKA
ncbi:carotenoid 1,2-hydratase [Rhodobacter sp. KR11]|uniref:carotenoid 1,2-hydratase n=1 Tax=Rhodobacter sp. KR11 TaxID=2974588 RepID=UPI0022216A61|nr:carotenoid 1,2-hydratase [Rhodobacter sp. KR11]MCW1920215.1 carotenoid 1,2-hydratase [Rhodobacter sp. KR11]